MFVIFTNVFMTSNCILQLAIYSFSSLMIASLYENIVVRPRTSLHQITGSILHLPQDATRQTSITRNLPLIKTRGGFPPTVVSFLYSPNNSKRVNIYNDIKGIESIHMLLYVSNWRFEHDLISFCFSIF